MAEASPCVYASHNKLAARPIWHDRGEGVGGVGGEDVKTKLDVWTTIQPGGLFSPVKLRVTPVGQWWEKERDGGRERERSERGREREGGREDRLWGKMYIKPSMVGQGLSWQACHVTKPNEILLLLCFLSHSTQHTAHSTHTGGLKNKASAVPGTPGFFFWNPTVDACKLLAAPARLNRARIASPSSGSFFKGPSFINALCFHTGVEVSKSLIFC